MKVTSINSTTSDLVLDVIPAYTSGWTFLQIGRAGINVPTADLLAALDATANTDVAGMRRDLIVAENAADEWKARAEEAEATIARVEAVIDGIGRNSVFVHEVRKALSPAFTLPTTSGVKFEARAENGDTIPFRSVLFGDSQTIYVCSLNDWAYTAEEVVDIFTGHRLIGAES